MGAVRKHPCKYTYKEYIKAFRVIEDFIQSFNLYDDNDHNYSVSQIKWVDGSPYLYFEEAEKEDFGQAMYGSLYGEAEEEEE